MAKVLVAEDDLENLDLLRVTLETAGHDVTTVTDGSSAAKAIPNGRFALLVLDVMMPGMDGYHLSSMVRELPIDQPKIILLTSRDFDKDKSAIATSEADVFISKPFEPEELIKTASDLLSQG